MRVNWSEMRVNWGEIRLYLCEFEVINSSGLSFVWKFQFLSNEMIFSDGFTSIFNLKSSPILNFLSFLWPVFVTFDLSTFHKSKNRVIFESCDLKIFSSQWELRKYLPGGHDNDSRIVFPDHLPKMCCRWLEGPLCADVSPSLVKAISIWCVYIIVVVWEVSI